MIGSSYGATAARVYAKLHPSNLSGLKQHFPDSRTVVFPRIGHDFNIGGCVDEIIADFAERGTTKGVDTTRCDGAVVVPPFAQTD